MCLVFLKLIGRPQRKTAVSRHSTAQRKPFCFLECDLIIICHAVLAEDRCVWLDVGSVNFYILP